MCRAWDTRLGVAVALKEMTPQPGLDPRLLAQLRQQFEQEAQVLARLTHPHLVRVTDFFEEGGNAYLVMNFVEGENLAERVEREGALAEGQVVDWGEQLLDALGYCHEQGVMHRDVKPENVVIRPDGQVVLVDFGLVKLWDPGDPRTKTAMRGMGTPEYSPPEQYDAAAGHTDSRSDIYSLGATLYHALTGQAPPTATQRIASRRAFQPPRAVNPRISPAAEAAILRAMELEVEGRFCTAGEMAAVLGGGIAALPPSAALLPQWAKVVTGAQSPSFGCAPVWVWALGGVVAVAALVAGVVAVLRFDWQEFARRMTGPTATVSGGLSEGVSVAPGTPITVPTSAVPASTPLPMPTATRQPPPTATRQPPPTATSLPTSTPFPTETPAPACPEVTGPFAHIWQASGDRLGCATGAAHTTWIAHEPFERGQMFWREDTDYIYVLYYNTGTWASYRDIWHEGDPIYSCSHSAPSESPPTPLRGFGGIWCAYPEVRDALGWATDCERGLYGTVQDFDRGVVLRIDPAETFALCGDGLWLRW